MVASPQVWVVVAWQLPLNQTEATASKCPKETLRHQCALHAYVLMDNHVHILATPDTAGALSRMMQWTASRYTIAFNDQHVRSGTLWEGRFFSSACCTS